MIFNMWANRKSAFKKRTVAASSAATATKPKGLVWPVTDSKTGERSSLLTGKKILAAAIEGVDAAAAKSIADEKNFRFRYVKHMTKQVQVSCDSAQNALKIARDGLAAAHSELRFERDGKDEKFKDAFARLSSNEIFSTCFVKGSKPKPAMGLKVPYMGQLGSCYLKGRPRQGQEFETIDGAKLAKQLDEWVAYGTIEKSAADAIKLVQQNPDWLDLSDRYFVLLGATSAMGPLDILLAHGANIIAIDINREGVWTNLLKRVRNSCGTVTFPVDQKAAAALGLDKGEDKDYGEGKDDEISKIAGANLLEQSPEICAWLKKVRAGKFITIGNYTYLDGPLHVQLSVACDAIIDAVCKARKSGVAIAFLCTPTDIHLCPKEAVDAASNNLRSLPLGISLMQTVTRLLGLKTMLVRNVAKPVGSQGHELYFVEGLVVAQVRTTNVRASHGRSRPIRPRPIRIPIERSLHVTRACVLPQCTRLCYPGAQLLSRQADPALACNRCA